MPTVVQSVNMSFGVIFLRIGITDINLNASVKVGGANELRVHIANAKES